MRYLLLFALVIMLAGCATISPPAAQVDEQIGRGYWVSKDQRVNVLRQPDRHDFGFLTSGNEYFTVLARVPGPYGNGEFYQIGFEDGKVGFLELGDISNFLQNGKIHARDPEVGQRKYLAAVAEAGAVKGASYWLKVRQPPIGALEQFTITDVEIAGEVITAKVTTPKGDGVIRFSDLASWKRDVYKTWPDLGWKQDVIDAIKSARVKIGMTKAQVTASWGEPWKTHRIISKNGAREQWVYANQYLYFENGVLTEMQD